MIDGRRLAYREVGDHAGCPVIYFHGVPGVREALVGKPQTYLRAGIRLITLDRPGYGSSSRNASARVVDVALDVAQLAVALGLERYAIVGESGGGPYALACGSLTLRPPSVVVVSSGLAPFDSEGGKLGMKVINRAALRVLPHRALADRSFRVLSSLFYRWPDFVFDQVLCRNSPTADVELLRRPDIRLAAKEMLTSTAVSGIDGVVDDIYRLSHGWGFAFGDIASPVSFWHGDRDNTAPLNQLRHIAGQIPGSRVTVCPGEGHMVMERHLAEILLLVRGEIERPAESRQHSA